MVERDDVAAVREPSQRVEIGVRTDLYVGCHQGGTVVGRGGQHAQ